MRDDAAVRPEEAPARAGDARGVPVDDDGAACRACGACCAAFRVSFHWLEGPALGLPDALVEPVTPHRVAMRGTHAKAPRCVALEGRVGSAVLCTTYASRPSPCREVQPGDERCTTARARHGMPALAKRVRPAAIATIGDAASGD